MNGDLAKLEMASLGAGNVLALSGTERMNELCSFRVQVAVTSQVSVEDLVDKPATLVLTDETGAADRRISLVAASAESLGEARNTFRYALTLVPPAWRLSRRRAHRCWVDKTTQEIVTDLVGSAFKMKWRLSGSYMKRLQCVQYAETDWSFLERLLAEEGIAYWWDETDAGPLLVFGDDPQSHDGIAGGPLLYRGDQWTDSGAGIFELESKLEVTSQAVHLRDFDVRRPSALIEGKAGEGGREVFEFPANVLTEDAAKKRAKARLDQLRRDERRLFGRGDTMRARPGFVVELDGCAEAEATGRFLVVSVEHDYRRPTPEDDRERPYESLIVMAPIAERTYRPAAPRSAPRVSELESAVVTGQGGEEIHVDDLGRVKIRMFWDRSGIADDRSSTWVRCLQMGMGGSMLLPRVGWEVPVAFAYGNPDQPVVLGRYYHANAVVPYSLPDAARRTSLQSATSPGGGSTNEIRMDDSAGTEEVFIHASRDQTVNVGGNSTTEIGNNEVYDVGLSHSVGVKGSQSHTVGAAQKVAVGTDNVLTVKGARTETIGAMEKIDVTGDVLVTAKGAYTETIGAIHGLECNQSNITVKGAFSQAIGGSLNLASGMAMSESVAAARSETVGGARVIATGKYTEAVDGAKTVTAGAATDKAAQELETRVKGDVHVSAASLSLSASGLIGFKATEVTFDVSGSLTAGALSLAGGTLKATKGTSKVKGKIKRQGETKIE